MKDTEIVILEHSTQLSFTFTRLLVLLNAVRRIVKNEDAMRPANLRRGLCALFIKV